jgi:amicyanin
MQRRDWALLAVVLAGAGCGSSAGSAPPSRSSSDAAPADTGRTVKVVMDNLAFQPNAAHANLGDRVTWNNQDNVPHNVVYVSGPKFASSPPRLRNGDSYSIKLTAPGTVRYYCRIHPWMKATIVVAG